MQRYFTLLLLCFVSFQLCAQNTEPITLTGTIFEQNTNTTLPYTNVSMTNNRLGTVSNINGDFKLIVPPVYQKDSIRVSHIGFQTAIYAISELTKETQIFLKKSSHTLHEVTVTALTAQSILNKALDKISENYYASPYISQGFYRVSSQKDQTYIHLSEAVFDIYHSQKNDQFSLIKMRALKDEKASHGLELGMKPKGVITLDFINHVDAIDLLNKKGFKNHDFKLEGIMPYHQTTAYVVSFDQKEGIEKAFYKGKFYIDTETFAFLYLDFELSPKGLPFHKYGTASQRMLMKVLDIQIGMVKETYQIRYKKVGDRYYLSDAGSDATLSFKSNRDHYDFTADTRVDYIVTAMEMDNVAAFEKKETLGNGRLIEHQDSPYDADFWANYNIILPHADFVAIAKVIEANNQAHNLKTQIQNRLDGYKKMPLQQRIDSILTFYNQKGSFNGNALIATADTVFFKKSYNNELTQNTDNTQFRIGSASKTFMAMLILLLEEAGELQVSDPIGKFLPTYAHPNITIEQLLSHQSGIPDYLSHPDYLNEIITKPYPLAELVTQFCSDTLEFKPGSQFNYTNSGFVVLAWLVETVTGSDFNSILKRMIFDPLGMTNTYFGMTDQPPHLAPAFLYGQPEPVYPIQNVTGAGGIISTTADLLKWSHALDSETLLPLEKIEKMWTPQAAYTDWEGYYGLGWIIDDYFFKNSKHHRIVYHPGTDFGFYAMFVKQPDAGITIVLLNNTGDFPRFDITDLILQALN